MKLLSRIVLIQFFLYDAEELDLGRHTAFLGQNGSGKSSLLDAIQIAMLGAHGNYIAFNTQSVGPHGTGHRNPRTIRDYCLGVVDSSSEGQASRQDRKRDDALTYISLVFQDEKTGDSVTVGACIGASAAEPGHVVHGLYVLPGLALGRADHLEQGQGGSMPVDWPDFVAKVRLRMAGMGRQPLFTTQPETYVREMLHALQQKGKSVNARDFLKTFNKSILLRNIDSIDGFIREFLIEAQAIDRRKAKTQIEHFKALSLMVTRVKEQVAALGEIRRKYEKVKEQARRQATLKALKGQYEFDGHEANCNRLESEIMAMFRNRRLKRIARENLAGEVEVAREAYDFAQQDLASQPGAAALSDKAKLLATHKTSFDVACRKIEGDLARISGVVSTLTEAKLLPEYQAALAKCSRELAHQSNRFNQELISGLYPPVQKAIEVLTLIQPELESLLAAQQDDLAETRRTLGALAGQVRNADRDGAPISREVARIVQALHEKGIEAEPVCNLVQITDPAWQPAIESFLKRNRESLVVTPGLERDAVAFLRGLPESENPFSVRIVQSTHLKDASWDSANTDLVGNLLTGENQVALRYLRALLGSMRCASSEEDLERYPRALTVDGMLSANFSTSRLRLLRQEDLLFGKRLTYAEKQSIRDSINEAIDREQAIVRKIEQIKDGQAGILKLGDFGDLCRRVEDEVAQANEDQLNMIEVQQAIASINAGNLQPLRDAVERRRQKLRDAENGLNERIAELAGVDSTLRIRISELRVARKTRQAALHDLSPLLEDELMDKDLFSRFRAEVDNQHPGGAFVERIRSCENRIKVAQRNEEDAREEALPLYQRYLDGNGILLGDGALHWRNALPWVEAEERRLLETELVERERDVENARRAAEEAFRNDVAVRMRESIMAMQSSISDINRTLATCPTFSNGERYRFKVSAAEAHKAIHDYIMKVGEAGELEMFSLGDEAQSAIMHLLDDAVSDVRNSTNPLDDYRLLFTFDLVISREGKKDTTLSKRLGVGSNGEHRSPFFVIAGAALAASYRLDGGKQGGGAGLMLLDEAMFGLDQQNSLAVGRFLDSIGLQMIMAAPEADHSKLAPLLDTVYELNRFENDIFIDQVRIKQATHRLLTSDLPSEHPDLIERMVEQIKAEEMRA